MSYENTPFLNLKIKIHHASYNQTIHKLEAHEMSILFIENDSRFLIISPMITYQVNLNYGLQTL